MLTDNKIKKSAYFPAALTLADLNNQSMSQESQSSEMDLSQSKLNRLGIDMSSLHAPMSSEKKDELSDVKIGLQEFNKSLQTYQRKFNDSADLSQQMEQFKMKIKDLQQEITSEPPNSDPYKISIHSIRKIGETTHTPNTQQGLQPQQFYSSKNQNNTSLSSGGLSFQPPHLHSTNNQSGNQAKADPIGNLSEQLEYRRLKYYDSFMPTEYKMFNNPLKYLKYKIQTQDKYNLQHCLDQLIN